MKKRNGKKSGTISRQDVAQRLAELAFGRANDCVRLVLEEKPELDSLDLSLLSEVRRNDKGMVEIRLIDRLQALEQLAMLAEADNSGMEAFLRAMEGEQP